MVLIAITCGASRRWSWCGDIRRCGVVPGGAIIVPVGCGEHAICEACDEIRAVGVNGRVDIFEMSNSNGAIEHNQAAVVTGLHSVELPTGLGCAFGDV